MFYSNCGKKVADGIAFCTECGKPLSPQKTTKTDSVVSKKAPVMTQMETKRKTVTAQKRKFNKRSLAVLAYRVLFFVICILAPVAFILSIYIPDTIKAYTQFDDSVYGVINIKEILQIMMNGNKMFNPTVTSTLISVSMYTLMYSAPIVTCIAFVGTVIGKKPFAWHTFSTIINIISAAALVLFTPLSLKFVPNLKQVLASEMNVLFEDISKFSYLIPLILAGLILILVIVSYIALAKLNRRTKDESK